jgi:hypothetical protein
MAAASFYRAARVVGRTDQEMIQQLINLSSADPIEHNPLALSLFLVTGRCRPKDRPILASRLERLNAVLLSSRVGDLNPAPAI